MTVELLDYEAACQHAAIRQGLQPVMEALTARGTAWDLWQSGGWTMVLTVAINPEGDFYGITNDGEDCYYIGRFAPGVEQAGIIAEDVSLEWIVDNIDRLVTDPPAPTPIDY